MQRDNYLKKWAPNIQSKCPLAAAGSNSGMVATGSGVAAINLCRHRLNISSVALSWCAMWARHLEPTVPGFRPVLSRSVLGRSIQRLCLSTPMSSPVA